MEPEALRERTADRVAGGLRWGSPSRPVQSSRLDGVLLLGQVDVLQALIEAVGGSLANPSAMSWWGSSHLAGGPKLGWGLIGIGIVSLRVGVSGIFPLWQP